MEAEAATDSNSIAADEETDCQSNSIAADKEIAADEEITEIAADEEIAAEEIAADEETGYQSNSIAADEKTDCQLSLNTLALMRKATAPDNISSIAIREWCSVLYKGVLLENNTQKFWVDKMLHKNCFLVLPKPCDIDRSKKGSCSSNDQTKKGSCLSIDWSQKGSCVSCVPEENWFNFPSAVDIHVIELKKLSWLLIEGRFKTRALSFNIEYEVAFVVKLIETDHGWQYPVELELVLPDETKRTRTEDLKQKAKGEWINLRAGKFTMDPRFVGMIGTIYFALHQMFHPQKSGLILRGVLIQPSSIAKQESLKRSANEAGIFFQAQIPACIMSFQDFRAF